MTFNEYMRSRGRDISMPQLHEDQATGLRKFVAERANESSPPLPAGDVLDTHEMPAGSLGETHELGGEG